MSMYYISAIQLDDDDFVQGARVERVNIQTRQTQGVPRWLEPHDLYTLIDSDNQVYALFPKGADFVTGPQFKCRVLSGGVETVDLSEVSEGRTLRDMNVVTERL